MGVVVAFDVVVTAMPVVARALKPSMNKRIKQNRSSIISPLCFCFGQIFNLVHHFKTKQKNNNKQDYNYKTNTHKVEEEEEEEKKKRIHFEQGFKKVEEILKKKKTV